MDKFYTNVLSYGNNICYRGVKNGRRVKMKIPYAPTLFLNARKKTEWTNIHGDYLEPMKFEDIREARNFIKRYEEVDNFPIYGNARFEYAFIADEFPGQVEWSKDQIQIDVIDLEVGSENGFPDPGKANEPLTAICITRIGGRTTVFGCGDYQTEGQETYIKCEHEQELCRKFLEFWQNDCPDVISGWNIDFFDVPYLVNRMRKILGDDETKKLSPWGLINERTENLGNKEYQTYRIEGISALDYQALYKWYAPEGKSRENYRLDYIGSVELNKRKISYDEFDNLFQLYKNDYQKFIRYNIQDVRLIIELDEKLNLFELALTLAYDTKCNYEDVFAQTRMWDAITYNYLLAKNIVVPPKEVKSKNEMFVGAYVKDPIVGLHNWVASFDLDSLYPHLMMGYNISPECLVTFEDIQNKKAELQKVNDNHSQKMLQAISIYEKEIGKVSVESLLNKQTDTSFLKELGCNLTPNGQLFRNDRQGFLPKILEEMYEDRKKFKKLMLDAIQEYENVLVEMDRRKIK